MEKLEYNYFTKKGKWKRVLYSIADAWPGVGNAYAGVTDRKYIQGADAKCNALEEKGWERVPNSKVPREVEEQFEQE